MPERLQRKLKKPVKYMEPKKVKIEKLPKSPWYKDPPIWIAIFALIATVVSLYLTREQYIKSSRPFVWGTNCEDQSGHPMPQTINIGVHNSHARIISLKYGITGDPNNRIPAIEYSDRTIYPDLKVIWKVDYGNKVYSYLFSLPDSIKSKLLRSISIEYSSLDSKKKYHYKLIQSYRFEPESPAFDEWDNTTEEAD